MECAEIRCDFVDRALRIVIRGEIDHHTAAGVREEIDRNIFFYRPEKLILDLSEITFMDSSGLGLILGRYTKMMDMGGSMEIENPSEEILKILKLAGVDKLFGLKGADKKAKVGYKLTKVKSERKEAAK